MRKIRGPNVVIKPREVFYQLKRNRLLETLDEATIEEILGKQNPRQLVDPGFLYENFETSALEDRRELGNWPMGGSFSAAVATIGDKGFEGAIKKLKSDVNQPFAERVLWAWGEVLLSRLADLTVTLVGQEAVLEAHETGPTLAITPTSYPKIWQFVLSQLLPQEKLGIKIGSDSGQSQIFPVLTKFWLTPWLTKKEKKQLAHQ